MEHLRFRGPGLYVFRTVHAQLDVVTSEQNALSSHKPGWPIGAQRHPTYGRCTPDGISMTKAQILASGGALLPALCPAPPAAAETVSDAQQVASNVASAT